MKNLGKICVGVQVGNTKLLAKYYAVFLLNFPCYTLHTFLPGTSIDSGNKLEPEKSVRMLNFVWLKSSLLCGLYFRHYINSFDTH